MGFYSRTSFRLGRSLVVALVLAAIAGGQPFATAAPKKSLASDVGSVKMGDGCLALGARFQDMGSLDGRDGWRFGWNEKLIRDDGIIAGFNDTRGKRSPLLLLFTYDPSRKIGNARLARISWTGPPASQECR